MMILEAFQYPTRLGRAASVPGGPFLPGDGGSPAMGRARENHLRRRPPRRPSRLRFRSAIFPSEEERNCFSLSSKA